MWWCFSAVDFSGVLHECFVSNMALSVGEFVSQLRAAHHPVQTTPSMGGLVPYLAGVSEEEVTDDESLSNFDDDILQTVTGLVGDVVHSTAVRESAIAAWAQAEKPVRLSRSRSLHISLPSLSTLRDRTVGRRRSASACSLTVVEPSPPSEDGTLSFEADFTEASPSVRARTVWTEQILSDPSDDDSILSASPVPERQPLRPDSGGVLSSPSLGSSTLLLLSHAASLLAVEPVLNATALHTSAATGGLADDPPADRSRNLLHQGESCESSPVVLNDVHMIGPQSSVASTICDNATLNSPVLLRSSPDSTSRVRAGIGVELEFDSTPEARQSSSSRPVTPTFGSHSNSADSAPNSPHSHDVVDASSLVLPSSADAAVPIEPMPDCHIVLTRIDEDGGDLRSANSACSSPTASDARGRSSRKTPTASSIQRQLRPSRKKAVLSDDGAKGDNRSSPHVSWKSARKTLAAATDIFDDEQEMNVDEPECGRERAVSQTVRRASPTASTSTSRQSRRASMSATRKSSKRKKRAISSDEESIESAEEKSAKTAPPVRRVRGDAETRAREYILTHPKLIFAEAQFIEGEPEQGGGKKKSKANSDGNASRLKGAPTARVAPTDPGDCTRRPLKSRALRERVQSFIVTAETALLFTTLQHQERLEVVRVLLPLAYSGEHNVEPLLRLLRTNCRDAEDPLAMLVATLRLELIDTRFCTQASSAHLTIFNYLVPLFMQRWGLMTAGAAAPPQWRSIGQKYANWNDFGRWPELLIVAPAIVQRFALLIFTEENGTASKFQGALASKIVTDEEALDRWCFVRRCAKVVNNDTTGKSVFMDLIVSPMAIWLRAYSPTVVSAALTRADEAALPSNPAERVQYPSARVYRKAVRILTELLAGAHASVTFGRLVSKSLAQATEAGVDEQWVAYSGGDSVLSEAIRRLQDEPPAEMLTSLSTTATAPTLTTVCRWQPDKNEVGSVIRFDVPLLNWRQLKDELVNFANEHESPATVTCTDTSASARDAHLEAAAHVDPPSARASPRHSPLIEQERAIGVAIPAQQPTSAVSSQLSSTALLIDGIHGGLPEEAFRTLLTACGVVQHVLFNTAGGSIEVVFEKEEHVRAALLAVYGTSTRQSSIRAIGQTPSIPASISGDVARGGAGLLAFGGALSDLRLATSLLLARAPPPAFATTWDAALDTILAVVRQHSELWREQGDTSATLLEASRRLLALAEEPYDFYAARLEFGPLFLDESACSPPAYLFLLREVVLEHLQVCPDDTIVVTPPTWFDASGSMSAACAPCPLFDVDGTEFDVSACRLLFIPLFIKTRPILIVVVYPRALDTLRVNVVPSFILLFGEGITTALAHKLLVVLFFRMESILKTQSAIVRPPIAIFKLKPTGDTANNTSSFTSFLQLAHAARTVLQLTATVECLALCEEFFNDETLIGGTRAILQALTLDPSGNPPLNDSAQSGRSRRLHEWRALAGVAARATPVNWNENVQTAAYTAYAVRRYQRALDKPEWTALKSTVSSDVVQKAYELICYELQQYGQPAVKAFCARLHQLYQRGFAVVGCGQYTIELCRRGTEHATLSLLDFSLRQGLRLYSITDEDSYTKTGWGVPPIWKL